MFVYETKKVVTINTVETEVPALAILVDATNQIPVPVDSADIVIWKEGDTTKVSVGSTVYPISAE